MTKFEIGKGICRSIGQDLGVYLGKIGNAYCFCGWNTGDRLTLVWKNCPTIVQWEVKR